MATPICTIDETGIHRPQFSDVLSYFVEGVKSIYGDDTYLGNDSADGQMIGLLSSAVDDCNKQTVATYNAFSPATAQGAGLSSVVKTNNIRRKTPSYSTRPVSISGTWGTEIKNGAVTDDAGNVWLLPPLVVVPFVGFIVVTATCSLPGAVSSPAYAIDTTDGRGSISAGQTRGWQSAVGAEPSSPGAPVESDAELRQRQSLSTSIPSQTTLEALRGTLLAVDGVTYVQIHENSGALPNADGVPGQSIAVVVDGGDDDVIARLIALKKGICGTYGVTQKLVIDAYGVSRPVCYTRSVSVPVSVSLTVKIVSSFSQSTQVALANALATAVSSLPIGVDVYRLSLLDFISGVGAGYKVENVATSRDGQPTKNEDVKLKFYERPYCSPLYVDFPGLPSLS